MKSLDLRTQAWLDDMFLYCGANVYGPDKLKEELAWSSEWAERLRRNFDHVLKNRSLTADDYADIEFENDEMLFAYVEALRDFLFLDGPYPEFEG
jgi:hypothetical protein